MTVMDECLWSAALKVSDEMTSLARSLLLLKVLTLDPKAEGAMLSWREGLEQRTGHLLYCSGHAVT